MTGQSLTSVDTARPWLRASAFGLVCASIGTFGHAFVMGTAPSLPVFVVAAVVLMSFVRMFVSQRASAVALLLGVTVAQLLVHATMLLSAPTTMHGMDHSSAAHVASAQSGAPLLLMLLVHAVAILLGVGVLLRVEQSAWSHVRSAVEAVVAFVVAVVRQTTRRPAVIAAPTVAYTADHCGALQRWITASVGRRGPPARRAHA